MSNRSIGLSEELNDYLLSVSLREDDVMRRLREETMEHPQGNMQTAPEQAQFMALLVQLMGARRTLEVGVFTGYSSLAVAQVLPEDGQIVACDISKEYTDVAQRYWKEAGVSDKIDLRLGPAVESLNELITSGETGRFDFAFIDADKESYDAYYERALQLVRPGGVVAIDNMFRGGRVVDPPEDDSATQAISRLNAKLHEDERIDISMIPIADGLTLARKREG